MSTKNQLKRVVFELPDGTCWIATYNKDNIIICLKVGDGRDYLFSDLYKICPGLMQRVKEQLESYDLLKENVSKHEARKFRNP